LAAASGVEFIFPLFVITDNVLLSCFVFLSTTSQQRDLNTMACQGLTDHPLGAIHQLNRLGLSARLTPPFWFELRFGESLVNKKGKNRAKFSLFSICLAGSA
jgi:hypothetical protein